MVEQSLMDAAYASGLIVPSSWRLASRLRLLANQISSGEFVPCVSPNELLTIDTPVDRL